MGSFFGVGFPELQRTQNNEERQLGRVMLLLAV